MIHVHYDQKCPACGHPEASMTHDTKTYEVWYECPNNSCINGPAALEVLKHCGYTEREEIDAITQAIQDNPAPFTSTIEQKVRWVEFCRALKEVDFTPGDILVLNGINFKVMLPEEV